MTFAMWVPAFVTSGLLALIGLAGGYALKAIIERGVQHGFDQELEQLKAKLKQDEESLKAQLRARDDQIAALRSTALAAFSSRQVALNERRLKADESFWAATVANMNLKPIS